MINHCVTAVVIAIMSLPLTVQASEAPAIPDFSKGIPGATVEKKQGKGIETFHLKTQLSSKEFSKRFRAALGAEWRQRIINKEEATLSARKAMTANATVTLSVFVHAKLPGVNIRVMHVKHKGGRAVNAAEIAVIRPKGSKAE